MVKTGSRIPRARTNVACTTAIGLLPLLYLDADARRSVADGVAQELWTGVFRLRVRPTQLAGKVVLVSEP
jgi:hypothetical protein